MLGWTCLRVWSHRSWSKHLSVWTASGAPKPNSLRPRRSPVALETRISPTQVPTSVHRGNRGHIEVVLHWEPHMPIGLGAPRQRL